MQKTITILRYVLIAAVALILIGLGWWYFFLNSKEESVRDADAGRGVGLNAPSFGSAIGSTYENILSSLASLAGPTDENGGEASRRLSQISKTPAAGMGFTGSGASTTLRFVERSTGYVLEVTPKTGVAARLTNTLIPRVYEAVVGRDGSILDRFIDEGGAVATILGVVPTASASSASLAPQAAGLTLIQRRLPDNIQAIAFSPNGKEIFYIVKSVGGDALGMRANADGTNPKQLFSTPVLGWHVQWLGDGRLILVQNASDGVEGYAYELAKDGSFSPLLPPAAGLTVLPRPSSSALIFGSSNGSSLTLSAQLDKKSPISELPLRTIADKCVWSPKEQFIVFCAVPQRPPPANFLDLWHRGEAHTSDAWWRVDMSAGSTELVYSPGDIILDVENPAIDGAGEYIAFMDAADKSLWLLRIKE